MRRYLLDTGIMGHFINHRHGVDVQARAARRRGDRIETCLPVVAELYFGAEYSSIREANLKRLKHGLSGLVCWPFERDAAEEYGRIAAA
jgi:tRNA(fMet)-specific endonuclease VapC